MRAQRLAASRILSLFLLLLGAPDCGPGALVWFRTDHARHQPVLSPPCPRGADVVWPHRERQVALDIADEQPTLTVINWAQRPQFVNEVRAFAQRERAEPVDV